MDRGRPQLDVFVRDAVTSAEICDATVELRVDGVDAPARLVISKDTSGACSYVTTGPTYTPARSAAIAVGRDGYESATTTVPPTPADECGYRRSAQATVALTLTK